MFKTGYDSRSQKSEVRSQKSEVSISGGLYPPLIVDHQILNFGGGLEPNFSV